jgi:hypothetical protein
LELLKYNNHELWTRMLDVNFPSVWVAIALAKHDELRKWTMLQVQKGKIKINPANQPFWEVLTNDEFAAHRFAALGETQGVRKLASADASLLTKMDVTQRRTPLWFAAAMGHKKVVEELADELIRQGQDDVLNTVDVDGFSPLHIAAKNNHVDVVRALLDRGGSRIFVNFDMDEPGKNADVGANDDATKRRVKIVSTRTIAVHGVDEAVSSEDKKRSSFRPQPQAAPATSRLLHWAAARGHYEVVKVLIKSQAVDLDEYDGSKRTALYLAANLDATRGAKIDVDSTWDPNCQYAYDHLGALLTVMCLAAHGADLSKGDDTINGSPLDGIKKIEDALLHSVRKVHDARPNETRLRETKMFLEKLLVTSEFSLEFVPHPADRLKVWHKLTASLRLKRDVPSGASSTTPHVPVSPPCSPRSFLLIWVTWSRGSSSCTATRCGRPW